MSVTLNITPLLETLGRHGVRYEILEHPRTERATAEALALGLPVEEVAKTIVVTTHGENVRVVLPAAERLDLHKVREWVGDGKDVHLLSEEDLAREYPEFEVGAVPPVGGRPDRVILDRRLALRDSFVLEAGVHNRSVRLEPQALIASADLLIEDICID